MSIMSLTECYVMQCNKIHLKYPKFPLWMNTLLKFSTAIKHYITLHSMFPLLGTVWSTELDLFLAIHKKRGWFMLLFAWFDKAKIGTVCSGWSLPMKTHRIEKEQSA